MISTIESLRQDENLAISIVLSIIMNIGLIIGLNTIYSI